MGLLLKAGADVNAVGPDRKPVLTTAILGNAVLPSVRLLLKNDICINICDVEGNNSLTIYLLTSLRADDDIVWLLFAAGEIIKQSDEIKVPLCLKKVRCGYFSDECLPEKHKETNVESQQTPKSIY